MPPTPNSASSQISLLGVSISAVFPSQTMPMPPAEKTSACKDQAGQEADLSGLFGKRLGLAQNIIN